MENSRIAGAKRRLAVAKRLTAGVAAVAFGVTFVAIRSGAAATSNTVVNQRQTKTHTQTTTESDSENDQSFFGNSGVGSSSGTAPSVSSSTS